MRGQQRVDALVLCRVIVEPQAQQAGRTETALGAFYRRLAARIGKAKALTGRWPV